MRQERTLGLMGATGVGVGAIVGGGIFVLAGVAFSAAGPGAMVAFAVNGVIAALTALSFAEMSAAFPVSGGAYTFARRVLSIRAAFGVGWILWFAYIVAGVLYALGFSSYAVLAVATIWAKVTGGVPGWLTSRPFGLGLASLAVAGYTLSLIRKVSGGKDWATMGKLVLFAVLLCGGAWALLGQPAGTVESGMTPFLPGGFSGLLAAMGFTFIAVQGFDLIAAIAGEVRDPERTIPRSMLLSLAIAMGVYLPLLFLVSTVGVDPGESIRALSRDNPDTVMALAAENFLGPTGYWLVTIAAILSTLSALRANVLAASRVASSMAGERTLPAVLGTRHAVLGSPVMALYATALTTISLVLILPDLAAAGAAASLIFLISFFLAHVTSILARSRGGVDNPTFQTPWFPLVPVVGGLACLALAVFQAIVVPSAGLIVVFWLALGGMLYLSLFASRAEAVDAGAEAADPSLVRLRGRSPLVLVPVANPEHAHAMVGIATALAPPEVGRLLLLAIITSDDGKPMERIGPTQEVLKNAIVTALDAGGTPEALITVAPRPWSEIARIARTRNCESLLLGLTRLADEASERHLEELLSEVDCDVSVLNAPAGWRLGSARRILVPIAGRGQHDALRARLLGALIRTGTREVTFLRVLPYETDADDLIEIQRALEQLAQEEAPGHWVVEVTRSANVMESISARAADHDLIVLGLQRLGRRRKVFGQLALAVARETPGATIMLSRK